MGRAWEDRQTQSPPCLCSLQPQHTCSSAVLPNPKGWAGWGGWTSNPGLGSRPCSDPGVSYLHFGSQMLHLRG